MEAKDSNALRLKFAASMEIDGNSAPGPVLPVSPVCQRSRPRQDIKIILTGNLLAQRTHRDRPTLNRITIPTHTPRSSWKRLPMAPATYILISYPFSANYFIRTVLFERDLMRSIRERLLGIFISVPLLCWACI